MDIIDVGLQFANLNYGNNPQMFILHHAEASKCSIEDIHQWHKENGWAGCGYHFLVRKDGSVYKGRPVEAIGSHCLGKNAVSIGICAEGNYVTEAMTDTQKNSIIELIKYLKGQYRDLPILGHTEAMDYETSCPGTNYPLDDIKNLKSVLYTSSDIKSIQHDLQRVNCLALGESIATGELDNRTKEAIRNFRNIIGLTDSYELDNSVVSALNAVTKKPTIGKGWPDNPIATKFIQWWIGATRTGIFDDVTVDKVKKWQLAEKIWGNPDGVVREQDWNKILK